MAVCLAATLVTCALTMPQDIGPSEPTREQRAVFRILDAFHDAGRRKRPLFRVTRRFRYRDGSTQIDESIGYVLKSSASHVTVRGIDLRLERLPRAHRDIYGHGTITVEPVSLRVAAILMTRKGRSVTRDWMPASNTEILQLMVLARESARRLDYARMQKFWDLAPKVSEIRKALKRELAERLIHDFAEARWSWHDLLARHDAWLEHFDDDSNETRRIRQRRGKIAETIRLEKDRGRGKGRAAELSALVANLRNERHPIFERPLSGGYCEMPQEPTPRKGTRPVDAVLARGLNIVPTLIETTGDEGLTRTVWNQISHARFRPITTLEIRTLGDLAHDTLAHIAGATPPGRDWDDWFDRARAEGIESALLWMLAHESSAEEAADSVLERYPRRLPEVLEAVSDFAGNKGLHARLVDRVADHEDPRVTSFLLREFDKTTSREGRVTVGRLLLQRSNQDAIRAITAWWSRRAREWEACPMLIDPDPFGEWEDRPPIRPIPLFTELTTRLWHSGTPADWRSFERSLSWTERYRWGLGRHAGVSIHALD